MKKHHLLLLATFLLAGIAAQAQKNELPLLFKYGQVTVASNITTPQIDSFNKRALRYKNKAYAVLQFDTLPGEAVRKQLSAQGIELLDYVPRNAYTVSIRGAVSAALLKKVAAKALLQLAPEQKMHPALAQGTLPPSAVKVAGTAELWFSFPKTFAAAEVLEALKEKNIDLISASLQQYRILSVRIAAGRIRELAGFPFVEYLQPAMPEDQPLNFNSRNASRANVLNAPVASGGKGLNGEGVVIGIGDNADVQFHADFSGRLINRAAAFHNTHGTHVHGTAAGGGIINEMLRGYASKATIVSQFVSGILTNAPTYAQDYGMVITSNSYGNNVGCDYNGIYDLYAYVMDQQAFELPTLQHVFAAGNSGGLNCAPFLPGFNTVLGGYQSAKNVLTVGNTNATGTIAPGSSKGPVRDGRVKPEIVAMGEAVWSTYPTNTYSFGWGTSMATPAVSGGLALLYQRYRQLHGNADPKSGLMKALICNGATDRGGAGPDFSYGYGWMNLFRSVSMIDNNHYYTASSTQGALQTQAITVPAGTARIKVMLYWHDPAASLISSQALVNDLDLELQDPGATLHLPGILNAAPGRVADAAAMGPDHTNNMEQVVIDNPAAGTYTIRVRGTAIAQNPSQEYHVVYDVIPVATTLVYPAGGESLLPGDVTSINWEAYGDTVNTFSLQYTTDGTTWNNIATGIPATASRYDWTLPAVVTSGAQVRIQRDGTTQADTSGTFTILGRPAISLAPVQCKGYIALNWTAVAGATDYEVMWLKGGEMTPVATTTGTSYTFNSLSEDSTYWVTVRARFNGKGSRRADALSRQPNSGTCSGSLSDNDLQLRAVTAPGSGRKHTASELTSATAVRVGIRNLDDAPIYNFTVQYRVNGGALVTENVSTAIAPDSTFYHVFATPADLSAPGTYTLTAIVKNNLPDPVTANDTLTVVVKHLDNPVISLATPLVDDMESAAAQTYFTPTVGLQGLDRFDLASTTPYGRLRTFVNSGLAHSGARALTLDADRIHLPGNTNYLTGTYNLTAYNAAANDVRLDFRFNQHSQLAQANNAVWVRGSDAQPWIEAYRLDANQGDAGTYVRSSSIELSDLLVANGQSFTGSFQVRWGQFGQAAATDRVSGAGYTFDDIRLQEVFNDLQLLRIDTPIAVSCALDAATPVRISVRNSSNNTLLNIPVKYRINSGGWVTETIASIGANTVLQYTFAATANLSALGAYNLEAIVDYATDNLRDNDTARRVLVNNPLIQTFPYLQDFEGGNGYWYPGGTHPSWEYGTPASNRINGAASGARAWKTRLAGNYNDNEFSYLYGPCLDVSGLSRPTLSFSVALDIEDCGANLCDAVWMEYSADGNNWQKLDTSGGGVNWYNQAAYDVWSVENYTRWHVATVRLPTGLNRLRLRFVLASDQGANREGIAIDDIHVYDNTKGIYDGITLAAPVTQTVAATDGWVDFESGGKLIASLHPNNQHLGATAVQVYRHSGAVRFDRNQYYLNRNLTIRPAAAVLADSATVRFYFLDTESDSLIAANACPGCSKPAQVPELGISKYSDADDSFENGTIADNQAGTWAFVLPAQVRKVPFDRGYYAEFRVKDFSEFWLNNGSFNGVTPLPLRLVAFKAEKGPQGTVLLQWSTADEENVHRYEVELARGNDALQQLRFEKIGVVAGRGDAAARTYHFTDEEESKTGVRHYRLRMVDRDGRFRYSPVRSVVFTDAFTWQVHPNPSKGAFHFVYQAGAGSPLTARVTDAAGRVVQEHRLQGSGQVQKLTIDLAGMAAGAYLLQVDHEGKTTGYTLYKQ